jgi:lysophospholipase L1-like esterase
MTMLPAGLLVALAISAAPPPPKPASTWPDPATLARMRVDWPWLGRYRAADEALEQSGQRVDVVFMGDSITQAWAEKMPGFFHPGVVGRGISAQTTPQMLLRFRQDVLDLRPRVVHIMAGTNDIAGNTGPMTPEETEANIMSMAELARAHGVRVVLGSIPPAAAFPWKPGIDPVERIRQLNGWMRAYAARTGAVYADYTAVLDDGRGGMRPGLSIDGVHPTVAGYQLMQPITERAVVQALGGERPEPPGRP